MSDVLQSLLLVVVLLLAIVGLGTVGLVVWAGWPHLRRRRRQADAERVRIAHARHAAERRLDDLTWSAMQQLLAEAVRTRMAAQRSEAQPAAYQRERRQLAAARHAAFAGEVTAANRVWQLDFSEFETTTGGTWRLAGCADYYSKYEFGWRISATANQYDAIAAVELAVAEAERLLGRSLFDACTNTETGEITPILVVTDNGGPFRAHRFATYIASRKELKHVRIRVRTPGQNGVRERAFGSLKYERLYREEITDGMWLHEHADAYRQHFNTVRPHEALSWNRPLDVHLGHADPGTPNFPSPATLPTT